MSKMHQNSFKYAYEKTLKQITKSHCSFCSFGPMEKTARGRSPLVRLGLRPNNQPSGCRSGPSPPPAWAESGPAHHRLLTGVHRRGSPIRRLSVRFAGTKNRAHAVPPRTLAISSLSPASLAAHRRRRGGRRGRLTAGDGEGGRRRHEATGLPFLLCFFSPPPHPSQNT